MMKPKKVLIAIFVIAIIFSFSVNKAISQVTDKDGNIYKTVTIGTQVWMAEDLKVQHYRNGDPITFVKSDADYREKVEYADQWDSLKTGAWCLSMKPSWDCYIKKGRPYCILYNGYAVNDARGLAPEGWHIASENEWSVLFNFLGGENIAGKKLKSESGWDWKYAKNGTNESGFNALPGGSRENGIIMGFGQYCYYWGSTGTDQFLSMCQIGYQRGNPSFVIRGNDYFKSGMSVRCVKD